jgi:hypothetical protein
MLGKRTWAHGLVAACIAAAACGGKSSTDATAGAGSGGSTVGASGNGGVGGASTTSGGGAGVGGAGGTSMPGPVVLPVRTSKVTKVDLLFMIDNSSSMADKHALLAQAVPDLVNRLVDPVCVNPDTGQVVGTRRPDGACTVGEIDFDPVKDLHVGIITSSLGGHGSTGVCDDPDPRKTLPHNDDHGHLVARDAMDASVPTFMNQGFLNWNPAKIMAQQPNDVAAPFATMVTGAGQHGCGYEASLEAVYRFLVDPDPYQAVVNQGSMSSPLGVAVPSGTDQVLLQQRYDFLRPDSAVAVVLFTDENDCSITDAGQGFYSIIPASGAPAMSVLGHGTTACLTNPNDPCCYNCFQSAPAGCPARDSDSECHAGAWDRAHDPENLRCWQQKKRYGVDFMYPVARYIQGLRGDQVPDRSGNLARNPLYSDLSLPCRTMNVGCLPPRDKALVIVEGIVGVPWQDIAVSPTDLTQGYLTVSQLAGMNVWSKILGAPQDPSNGTAPPVLPTDPHMVESIAPRQGLPGPGSAANADPINGHEWDISMASPTPNADLQYACTFPLPMPKTCTEQVDCDCFAPAGVNPAAASNPLCQNASGQYSNVQTRAKAYPGIRQLQVLQGLGDQAVVASICAANTSDTTAVDYGYRPAVGALVKRMGSVLRGHCFSDALKVQPSGAVACKLIEAYNPPAGSACTCTDVPGRTTADPSYVTPEVRALGSCFCQIVQLDEPDRTVCKTQVVPPGSVAAGWCYVDPLEDAPGNGPAECAVLRECPRDDKRMIRFVTPSSEPRAGAAALLVCDSVATPPINVDACP